MKEIKLTSLTSGGGCGCKIPANILNNLLKNYNLLQPSKKLLVGKENSDDAAVYKFSESNIVVASTDFFTPIVDNPYDFGKISATNALSDIYAMGSKPQFALGILAAPFDILSIKTIKKIMSGGSKMCLKSGAMIAGGHTIRSKELIYGLVTVGQINEKNIIKNSGARNGDKIIITKPLGIGILSAGIKKNHLTKIQYKKLISVTTELNICGYLLAKEKLISSMTDITGFGLIGHLKEMCISSKKSAIIKYNELPILNEARFLLHKGIYTGGSKTNWESTKRYIKNLKSLSEKQKVIVSDPQTSGGLLIAVPSKNLNKVMDLLNKTNKFKSKIVGEFINNGKINIEFITN
tara:strand:+ start:386 stop:1435 length:1050 start_codon:yes stop_codon:yes gene_type:complete